MLGLWETAGPAPVYDTDKEGMPTVCFRIPTDFREVAELLTDVERGWLFTAMLSCALDGSLPELAGSARFVWPMVKGYIDREAAALAAKADARRKARRGRKPERKVVPGFSRRSRRGPARKPLRSGSAPPGRPDGGS